MAVAYVFARQLLVRRKIRGRDDFRGFVLAPSREFASIADAVSQLCF
jgi:hypothetical protein